MLDQERRSPYWRATRRLSLLLLAGWSSLFCLTIAAMDMLNQWVVLGFPLGLLLAGIVIILLAVAFAFWFSVWQDRIDERYGANEEI